MAQLPIIAATTAEVATQQGLETAGYADVIVSANNLAGAEEVDIYYNSGGTWIVATDLSGNAVKLTATVPLQVLVAGGRYGFTKDATAGACGVFADFRNYH